MSSLYFGSILRVLIIVLFIVIILIIAKENFCNGKGKAYYDGFKAGYKNAELECDIGNDEYGLEYIRGFKDGVRMSERDDNKIKAEKVEVEKDGHFKKVNADLKKGDKVRIKRNGKSVEGELVYVAEKVNADCRFGIIKKNNCPWDKNREGNGIAESYSIYWQDIENPYKVYALGLPTDEKDIQELQSCLEKMKKSDDRSNTIGGAE